MSYTTQSPLTSTKESSTTTTTTTNTTWRSGIFRSLFSLTLFESLDSRLQKSDHFKSLVSIDGEDEGQRAGAGVAGAAPVQFLSFDDVREIEEEGEEVGFYFI